MPQLNASKPVKGQTSLLCFFGKKPTGDGDRHFGAKVPDVPRHADSTKVVADDPLVFVDTLKTQVTAAPLKRSATNLSSVGEDARGLKAARTGDTAAAQQLLEPSQRRDALQGKLCAGETKQQEAMNDVQRRFNWLDSKSVRDASGKRPGEDSYDERTLRVPQDAFSRFSDSQKQYWSVKKQYRDVIVFFKVGKFYELYEDDAQVGHDVLDWKMTITGVGHCRQVGCPESGIDEACSKLVAAGYKVARMEQMETAAEAKAKRGNKACIRRELQPVVSPATATSRLEQAAIHLLALYEYPAHSHGASPHFGFGFLDSAAGHLYIGSLEDTSSLSNLNALLIQVSPKEVLTQRGGLSTEAARLLQNRMQSAATVTALTPGTEFPDSEDAAAALESKGLWGPRCSWPDAMQEAPSPALAALAALSSHLQRLKADGELLKHTTVCPYTLYTGAMRLDGPTLANLELVESAEGGREGSLLARLDTCISAGGKRMLRAWLCRPLCDIGQIERRLDAVEELCQRTDLVDAFTQELRSFCDMERVLGRVRHLADAPALGLPLHLARARQTKRVQSLALAAASVLEAANLLRTLANAEATLLVQATHSVPGEDSPALSVAENILQLVGVTPSSASFKSVAKMSGLSLSAAGMGGADSSIDVAGLSEEEAALAVEVAATSEVGARFLEHATVYETMAKWVSKLDVLSAFASFATTSDGPTCRPRFLPPNSGAGQGAAMDLQEFWHPCAVPIAGGGHIVPNNLRLGVQQKKSVRREGQASLGASLSQDPQQSNDSGHVGWKVQALMDDDLPQGEKGRGIISTGEARTLLLTGPNMGGKSTLLRATCVAAVLAQAGCFVPASRCRLTPVDQIFSRLGASDRIMSGHSTFMVECQEASAILANATPSSLVVMDELGRGTSTFDGYAIAAAVLRHMADVVDCRLLFATHYHALTAEFAQHPRVACGHMAAVVDGVSTTTAGRRDSDASSLQSAFSGSRNLTPAPPITFLYRMCEGACPKSYGMQVAALAGIPSSILAAADSAGARMEASLAGKFAAAAATGAASYGASAEASEAILLARSLLRRFGDSAPVAADVNNDSGSAVVATNNEAGTTRYHQLIKEWQDLRPRAYAA